MVLETQPGGGIELALQDAALQRLAEKDPAYYGANLSSFNSQCVDLASLL